MDDLMRTLLGLAVIVAGCGALRADPILPNDIVASALAQAECTVPLDDASDNMSLQHLCRGLKLVEVSCLSGAYNFASILFAVDLNKVEKARLLRFQTWADKSFKPTYVLTLPTFDPKTQRLTSFHKGRGVGDCGTMGQWLWSGSDFKMTDYWNKETCDGKEFGFGTNVAKWRVFPKR
jgi:hypothetical protein